MARLSAPSVPAADIELRSWVIVLKSSEAAIPVRVVKCRPLVQRLERLDAVPRRTVPAQAIDRGMQHASIGGERLQRAARPAGPDERDEIGRLQLAVDECMERALGVLKALDREAQIVDHDRQRALHRLALHGRWGPKAATSTREPARADNRRSRRFAPLRNQHRHELGKRHRLPLAILTHLEILGGQVADDAAIAIGHDRIDPHGVDTNPEAWRLTRLLSGGQLERTSDRCPQQDSEPNRQGDCVGVEGGSLC